MQNLRLWKNSFPEKAFSSGIVINMLLVIFCIAILLVLAYISLAKTNAENAKSQYAQSGINEKTNQQSNSMQGTIDTNDHSQTATGNMDSKIRAIKQQSESQFTLWQQKNADATFSPENIIPTYFKTFNGDLSQMHARK